MTARHPVVVLRLAVVLLLSLAAVLLGARSASAHTALVSASPSASTTLSDVPARVELAFTSPVQARLAQVVVSDAGGDDRVVGPAATFDSRVVADLAPLGPGVYQVAYRVVAPDGHPIMGEYSFTVAPGASAAGVDRGVTDAGAAAAAGGGRPWLVPAAGLLAVLTAVGLRIVHGVRRAATS